MNANRRLMTLMGILIVLIALLLGLKFLNAKEENRLAEEEKASFVEVTDLKDLKSISYTYQEEKISLTKKKGKWKFRDEPGTKLDQTYPNTMEEAITTLTSSQEITNPDRLKYYGLKTPSYTIKATDKKGKKCTIYIGDSVNGDYYFTLDDKSHIYIGASDLVSSIQYEKKDLKISKTKGSADSPD